MEKEKNIPTKNYIILAVVLILTVLIVIYFYMWHNAYEQNKLNTRIIDENIHVINYNELNNYLVENKDCIIYSSVLQDQKIRSFEKRFNSLLKKESLTSEILYLDLTEELKNKDINKEIKKNYSLNSNSLGDVPSITVFKDGKIYSIYNIDKNSYSINEIKEYLKEVMIDD